MPYGDNDWLALTAEPSLEPDLPICDAHHHFWDFRMDRVPYHRYLLDELAADVNSGHNVRSTVFLEARSMYRPDGPEELRPVGEVEFVQGIAAASATGLYGPTKAAAAIIGAADLALGGDVARVLDALQAASPNRFRGIRYNTGWDPHPELDSRSTEHKLADPQVRAGAQVLSDRGLVYENVVYFPQLSDLVDFANVLPDLTIVSNHIGGLIRIGPYGNRDDEVMPAWRGGVAALAQCPNVVMKLGGVGQPRYGFDWHTRATPIGSEQLAEEMGPLITYCIDQFGPDRCLFESNFPPDKVSFSYNVMYNAFKRMTSGYSASERAAMFHDNAARIYSIEY